MKKLKFIFFIIFIIIVCLFIFLFNFYRKYDAPGNKVCSYKKNYKNLKQCYFNQLLPKILIYDAKINNKKIEIIKPDWSERLVAKDAIEKSDVLFGYGIYTDIGFEDNYSLFFDKEAFAFDCGIDNIKTQSSKCHFEPECIGTDKYLLAWQPSSKKIHTFSQKIKDLNLEDKKIFIKMDIAGAEKEVMDDILEHSDQITGMVIGFHFDKLSDYKNLGKIFDQINKDFIVIARNSLNTRGIISFTNVNSYKWKGLLHHNTLILSYINKNLVDEYEVSINQDTKSLFKNYKEYLDKNEDIPSNNIIFLIPIMERIKSFEKKIWK